MVELNPHALAILGALTAAGLAAGDGEAPKTHTGRYVVLYMISGGETDGTAADPDEWIDGRFQLTCVGRSASEARWVADQAGKAVTAPGAVQVAGRGIQRVRPLDGGVNVQRDDDPARPTDGTPQTGLFYATRDFGFYSFEEAP